VAAELMYGAHYAKDFVNTYLQSDIPRRLVRYRNGWALDDISLPNPVEYLTYEPLALDVWPTIITVAISTKRFERTGYEPGMNPLYRVVYGMRTYIWVRTEGSQQTTEMRDRLTTVVRSAIMDHPCLQREGAEREAMVEETTLTEEFSDLTLLKGDRVLAGAYLGYDLILNEAIARDNIADEVLQYQLTIGQNPLTAIPITNFTNAASVVVD
jgi:hypothetical protein